MNSNPSKRSSLFLLELMIAILFFCLCSAVCIRLFVQSHIISNHTHNLSMAINYTTNFAEIYRSEEDYMDVLKEQFRNGVLSNESNLFTLYCDGNWIECSVEDAAYAVSITVDDSGEDQMSLAEFKAVVIDDSGARGTDPMEGGARGTDPMDTIYQFTTEKYIGGDGNE